MTGARAMTWRRLQWWSTLGQLTMCGYFVLAPLVAGGSFEPTSLTIGLFVLPGFLLLRRRGKAGTIWAGVISILLVVLIFGVFQGYKSLAHPESPIDFVGITGITLCALVGVVAFAGALRRPDRQVAGGKLVMPAIGAIVAMAAVAGLVASASAADASRRPGDIALTAENLEWQPKSISAQAGRIGIFLDNNDVTHHDFTIAGVARTQLPQGKHRRVELDLQAGTYNFRCTLHSDMKGTLRVS